MAPGETDYLGQVVGSSSFIMMMEILERAIGCQVRVSPSAVNTSVLEDFGCSNCWLLKITPLVNVGLEDYTQILGGLFGAFD